MDNYVSLFDELEKIAQGQPNAIRAKLHSNLLEAQKKLKREERVGVAKRSGKGSLVGASLAAIPGALLAGRGRRIRGARLGALIGAGAGGVSGGTSASESNRYSRPLRVRKAAREAIRKTLGDNSLPWRSSANRASASK